MGNDRTSSCGDFARLLGRHLAPPLAGVWLSLVATAPAQAQTTPTGWTPVELPASDTGEGGGEDGAAGFAWFRAYVHVPESWRGSRLLLVAGGIDGVDEAFFNGEKIGANGSMPPLFATPASDLRRPFVVEPDLVRFGGDNLIAWRVYSEAGAPAISRGPLHLSRKADAIDLAGTWLRRTGDLPAFAGWSTADPDPDSHPEAEAAAFREAAGARPAGHRGVVPADLAGRGRLLGEVEAGFENNPNPYSHSDDKGDPLTPEEALAAMRPAPGLAVDLVLAEPLVRQPLSVEFDARGRLWLTQYIQYPDPAGLEVLTWDRHLRKVFDAVPPPPPYGSPDKARFRGRDVISIHEDTDGDGVFDDHKVFLDGLNLATATAQDNGGVWVLQPPYLLFYADADRDDLPDGDGAPVVHLSGFGLEDTHSVANSLKFGPDGWLYGATGSTVTARVRTALAPDAPPVAFFGQAIWRYHPRSHRFELFAEGGWNNFGVDFDSKGRLYSGTNGTQQAVYFVQGGFYQKSFGKHGPHTNPYAFGHFGGLPIEGEKVRLVHQWIRYEGGAVPELDGLLVGPNALASKLHALRLTPDGSRFLTTEVANPLVTDDRWFRPVHATAGPDGAVYISDFYDARITHVDPRDNWDRERGRVYRVRPERPAARAGDPPRPLAGAAPAGLVDALESPNRWRRETARRLLAARHDNAALGRLRGVLTDPAADGQLALEALWALHACGALDAAATSVAVAHRDPHVRKWAVRLLGDDGTRLAGGVAESLVEAAGGERHPEVVSQLASTAGRLVPDQAVGVIGALVRRHEFAGDPLVPLQCWWAFERLLARDRNGAIALLTADSTLWDRPLVEGTILARTARRLMAERTGADIAGLGRLLDAAPAAGAAARLVEGMTAALAGTPLPALPPGLAGPLAAAESRLGLGETTARLRALTGGRGALGDVRRVAFDRREPTAARTGAVQTLARTSSEPGDVERLLALVADPEEPHDLRLAALNAVRRAPGTGIGATLTELAGSLPDDLGRAVASVMAGRPDWARRLVAAVAAGDVPAERVTAECRRTLAGHGDDDLAAAASRAGLAPPRPAGGNARRIAEITAAVNRPGPPAPDRERGREVFASLCAACHRFQETGREVGPDLTGYPMDDTAFLATAIADPNLGVREGFELATLTLVPKTPDAPAVQLVGFVTDATADTITVRDLAGGETTVARSEVGSESRAPFSVMPEGLLDTLSDQQVRDLFAFLRPGAEE